MDATSRRTADSVAVSLTDRPWTFEFFQAVRLLTLIAEKHKPVGEAYLPSTEAVRFRVHRSLGFPAAEIYGIESQTAGPSSVMWINFMGLVGFQGVLPAHYNDSAGLSGLTHEYDENPFADFLDLFHHRLISLFYRAWEKYRLPLGFERRERRLLISSGPVSSYDRLTTSLLDVIGLGATALRQRQSIPDTALLRYAGLIAQRPHSAIALQSLLSDYFQVDVEILQFRGRWFSLQRESLSWLAPEGVFNELGRGALAGDAVWNQQAAFCVRLGPLSLERLLCFLPGQPASDALNNLVVFCAPTHLEFEVQLVLLAGEVPYCSLGDESSAAPRLGLLSWLKTGEFKRDSEDVVFLGSAPFVNRSDRTVS